ncbi:MAG: TorF family putative porin [Burkholderiales bacterium]
MNNTLRRPSVSMTVLASALTGIALFGAAKAHAQAAPAPAPTPEHTFATKVSVYSEYEYRGISQTSEKPALQLNLDYSHSSGFYLGTFLTNVKWLKDSAKAGGFKTNADIEWDIFGGFKFELVKDVTMDIGYLRYEYPSSGAFNPKPDTDEVYVGLSGGPFSAKYSYSTSTLFGFAGSKGSTFTELNWAQEVLPKFTMNAQVARQTIKKNNDFSYTVYKIGGTYDLGDGWALGGYYKDTNAKKASYTVLGKDWSKGRLVAFVSKSF